MDFERIIMKKKKWIVIEGEIDGMEKEEYERIRDMMDGEMKDEDVINMGKKNMNDGILKKKINMEDDN